MTLGKIKVRIEQKNGRPRWFFCRPVSNTRGNFPSRIGICHVVEVEKSEMTQNWQRDEEYEFFAIFYNKCTYEQFNNSYCKLKVSPITEELYNSLMEMYPQETHAFEV